MRFLRETRNPPRVSILTADDTAQWRTQARIILQSRPEWKIVGEACDGTEAIRKASELQPDIVLLDIGMPVMNGLEAAKAIQKTCPGTRIVFLTQDNDPEIESAAAAIGAAGYVRKIDAARKLIDAISAALNKS